MKKSFLFIVISVHPILENSEQERQQEQWSKWTGCSNTCGKGLKIRSKKCFPGALSCRSDPLYDVKLCAEYHLSCDSTEARKPRVKVDNHPVKTAVPGSPEDKKVRPCPNCWSIWSKCSSRCGNGFQMRIMSATNQVTQKSTLKEIRICVAQDRDCVRNFVNTTGIDMKANLGYKTKVFIVSLVIGCTLAVCLALAVAIGLFVRHDRAGIVPSRIV